MVLVRSCFGALVAAVVIGGLSVVACSSTSEPTNTGAAKKKNTEVCATDAECESGKCYVGGNGGRCTVPCTNKGANDPACVAPFTGKCNNQGFCQSTAG